MKLISVLISFELTLCVEGFLFAAPRDHILESLRIGSIGKTDAAGQRSSMAITRVFASPQEEEEDDDEIVDMDTLGDWRAFRMNLAATDEQQPQRERVVSKLNEDLLRKQNSALAEEYVSTAWAHETPQPEIGGLVCRLPLEAEIYRNKSSKFGAKLQKMIKQKASYNNIVPTTTMWYRGAQKLIKEEMINIQKSSNGKGEVNASNLSPEALDFLQMYMDNQSTWQEVCLVVKQVGDECTTLVLNRPISKKANEDLGKIILFGQKKTFVLEKTQRLINFLNAFEDSCAVYVGGPDEQEEPAMILHGIAGLEGAVELSPFSNIFEGGLDAAIQGIMAGKYDPLEFRFFIGKHLYKDNMLQRMVHAGKYQPVACAKVFALKQCISLPKPLWNEVMEMCGGELKVISKLELLKRNDIQNEEVDDDTEDGDENFHWEEEM